MKEKTEKFFWFFLVPLGVGIILLIVNAVIGGITFKMVYETLMDLDILGVSGVIFLIISAIFGALYVKERWKASIGKKEGELSDLKSELEDNTKQHDALVELMKLPQSFDKAITVEQSSKFGKSHLRNQIVVDIPGDKPPRLYFDMKVVNRTCIHSFEAEEIEINCFCGGEPVCSCTWNKKIGQPKPEAFDKFSDLPRFEDGTIEFHIPLEKLYNNLEKWTIEGTAKYRSKEPLIEDNTRYASPKIGIHLEFVLLEKQIPKLKKEVEKALGEEV
jgi:hypothetical protein